MSTQAIIESKLVDALNPQHLEVVNESHMHGGPATESHYKVTIITNEFDQKMLVKRHQEVYRILSDELSQGVHALALHTYSPAEWAERNASIPSSPNCRGGSSINN